MERNRRIDLLKPLMTQLFLATLAFQSLGAPAVSDAELEIDSPSNFLLSVGTFMSQGSIGSQTVTTRSMSTASGYLLIGHKSGYITPFLIGTYDLSAQSTDSSKVSGTNMSGSRPSAGLGLRVSVGSFFLSGAYLPMGTLVLSRQTSDSQQVSYSEPNDVLVFLGYAFESFSAFAVHRSTSFSRVSVGTTGTAIGADKMVATSLGGGIEWSF